MFPLFPLIVVSASLEYDLGILTLIKREGVKIVQTPAFLA